VRKPTPVFAEPAHGRIRRCDARCCQHGRDAQLASREKVESKIAKENCSRETSCRRRGRSSASWVRVRRDSTLRPYDPFLLFDDFRNDDPKKYANGFPWHPHRGIETITYVLEGRVDHADSLGNRGKLGAGDIQWMTAGSGILHQEMPRGDVRGRMHGFQLWANLPARHKMTKPRYQDVAAREIPTVVDNDGTTARVLCGEFWGRKGPVEGIAADPRYLDISVPANTGHGKAMREFAGNRSLVLFDQGDSIRVESGDEGGRFLLVSGEPIKEPVAWRGPIVMNTQAELKQAFRELQEGTFIRK